MQQQHCCSSQRSQRSQRHTRRDDACCPKRSTNAVTTVDKVTNHGHVVQRSQRHRQRKQQQRKQQRKQRFDPRGAQGGRGACARSAATDERCTAARRGRQSRRGIAVRTAASCGSSGCVIVIDGMCGRRVGVLRGHRRGAHDARGHSHRRRARCCARCGCAVRTQHSGGGRCEGARGGRCLCSSLFIRFSSLCSSLFIRFSSLCSSLCSSLFIRFSSSDSPCHRAQNRRRLPHLRTVPSSARPRLLFPQRFLRELRQTPHPQHQRRRYRLCTLWIDRDLRACHSR
jgi:hypothetical protein